jgi:hypothetical protein
MTAEPGNGRTIVLGENLFSRMRNRPYYSPDAYCKAFAGHEGETCEVSWVFRGVTGLAYAYTVLLSGKAYHLPALFVEEQEPHEAVK